MPVRPYVRLDQLGSHWTDFYEIWDLDIFLKRVGTIQVLFISNKNNGYFAWKLMYNFDYISFNSSYNADEIYRGNQNTPFIWCDFDCA